MCKSSGVNSIDPEANVVAASGGSDDEDNSDTESPISNDEHSPANRSPSPGYDVTTTEKEIQRQILAENDSEERSRLQTELDWRFANRRRQREGLDESPSVSPSESPTESPTESPSGSPPDSPSSPSSPQA